MGENHDEKWYKWVRRTEDNLPEDTILGGTDEGDHPLYVARFHVDGRYIVGKAGTRLAGGYYYQDGRSIECNTYEVLTFDHKYPAEMIWEEYSPATWGDMKKDAIGTLEDGYVARAPAKDGKWPTPGNMKDGKLTIAYRHGVGPVTKFEVLIMKKETPLETRMYDLKYTHIRSITKSTPLTVASETVENLRNDVLSTSLSLSYIKSMTHIWKNNISVKLGLKVEYSAGIPFLEEGEVKVSAETQYSHGWDKSETESTTVDTKHQLSVRTGEAVTVKIIAAKMVVNIPYTAKIWNKYRNDIQETFTIDGTYTGVGTVGFRTRVEDNQN